MRQATLAALGVIFSAAVLGQSLTLKNKLELTVTKVERLTTWQPPRSAPPVAATPGKEFAKLYFSARIAPDASGDPCNIRAGEFELVDADGGKVLGLTIESALAADTPWSRRCEKFAVEFQESLAGVDLSKLRVRNSEADISKVSGSKGRGKR